MTVGESVPLTELTTFRLGGPARYVIDVTDTATLVEALAFARDRSLPFRVLGEGSNLLVPDAGYPGVVLRMQMRGTTYEERDGAVEVTIAAGESWDTLVREIAGRGLWGIENLAGIPGTVGAAPVQNIGAYGTELADTLIEVEAYDARTGETLRFPKEDCGLGYRESRFKHEPDLIITSVTLRLTPAGSPQLGYADLARARGAGVPLSTTAEIGNAVREIRSRKFPDSRVEGTAGSFFKNPIISRDATAVLEKQYPDMPRYPAGTGSKVPLAYILDKILGLRGYRIGPARLFEAQPLVLVADRGATAADVERLADDVARKVFDATNIVIEREVRTLE